MQNLRRLESEIGELVRASLCEGVDVVGSEDRWNPVSVIRLRGLTLPTGCSPHQVDVTIPIPNLYGFATTCVFAVFHDVVGCGGRRPPFFKPIRELAWIQDQRDFYVAFREPERWGDPAFLVCLTPDWTVQRGYSHHSLAAFVRALLEYVVDGRSSVELAVAQLQDREGLTPAEWRKLVYLRLGLGDICGARRSLELALGEFPFDHDLRGRLSEYVRHEEAVGDGDGDGDA